jgi:hypothetical protein
MRWWLQFAGLRQTTSTRSPTPTTPPPDASGDLGPPAERLQHRVLWRGRTGDRHGRTVDPGLLHVPADAVSRALESLPAGEA